MTRNPDILLLVNINNPMNNNIIINTNINK